LVEYAVSRASSYGEALAFQTQNDCLKAFPEYVKKNGDMRKSDFLTVNHAGIPKKNTF